MTPSPQADGAQTRVTVLPPAIPATPVTYEEELDAMVNRIFRELKRQLAQIENVKPPVAPAERSANVRALASIERTLERLARMEQDRVSRRETRMKNAHDEARAALERRLDQLLAAACAPQISAKPER